MPVKWIVNGETLVYSDMTSGMLTVGDDISLNALKLTIEKDNHAITAYLPYALTEDGVTASALLPFNVEIYATD